MRVYPVADGVLKHQLYVRNADAGVVFGQTYPPNINVTTFWTYKAAGSPVSGARVAAEQDAIRQWCDDRGRIILPGYCKIEEVRTWDYGLDPAPRTVLNINPDMPGTRPSPSFNHSDSYIIALRSQPGGSVIRNRLNGRLYWPLTDQLRSLVSTYFNQLLNLYLNPVYDADCGNWVLISWRTGGVERGTPLVVPINHIGVDRYGIQRRRDTHWPAYPRGY